MKKVIVGILLIIWQLPQVILGLVLLGFLALYGGVKRIKYEDGVFFIDVEYFKPFSFSCGPFLFVERTNEIWDGNTKYAFLSSDISDTDFMALFANHIGTFVFSDRAENGFEEGDEKKYLVIEVTGDKYKGVHIDEYVKHLVGQIGEVFLVEYEKDRPNTIKEILQLNITATINSPLQEYFLSNGFSYDKTIIFKINHIRIVNKGEFIEVFSREINRNLIDRHEYGHCLQSHILGPLWIPFIFVPSLIVLYAVKDNPRTNAFLKKWFNFEQQKMYWERWADKLAGVDRINIRGTHL
jgi:hypothetical protein